MTAALNLLTRASQPSTLKAMAVEAESERLNGEPTLETPGAAL